MKSGFLLTLILFSLSVDVNACQCYGTGTIKESISSYDGVIHGKVVRKELVSFAKTLKADQAISIRNRIIQDKNRAESFDNKQIVKIDLQVIEILKGNITSDTVTIFTTNGGPSCGFEFELNQEYIVYGNIKGQAYSSVLNESTSHDNIERENSYWTNRCTRTTVFNRIELGGLRELKK